MLLEILGFLAFMYLFVTLFIGGLFVWEFKMTGDREDLDDAFLAPLWPLALTISLVTEWRSRK